MSRSTVTVDAAARRAAAPQLPISLAETRTGISERVDQLLEYPWCQELIATEGAPSEDVRRRCHSLVEGLKAESHAAQLGRAWLRSRQRAEKYNRLPVRVKWSGAAVLVTCIASGAILARFWGPWAGWLGALWTLCATLWIPTGLHERYRKAAGLEHAPAELSRAATDLDRRIRSMMEGCVRLAVQPVLTRPDRDTVSMGEGEKLSSRALQGQRLATPSRSAIESHMIRIGGAAVGVTGERGMGKTEALRSFCDDPSARATIKEGGTIGVFVAVPAAFKGPEFLQLVTRRLIEAIPGYQSAQEHHARGRRNKGMVLIVLGLATAGASYVVPGWIRLPPVALLREYSWIAGIATGLLFYAVGLWMASRATARGRSHTPAATVESAERLLKPRRLAVARQAQGLLLRLHYAETITATHEGSLTLGKLGLKRSSQRSLNAMPLTEADLVAEFAALTDELDAVGYRVIVCIDEMDKLEAGESTEGFLNSVKQLFAVRSSSFVVSVSNSAWSTFARRGVNVRDALDSSLDAIETLAPLDFLEVRSLIRKRGEKLTDSQVLFCHCFSGGLPREVLRAARSLAKLNGELGGAQKLSVLAGRLVEAEVKHLLDSWSQEVRSWEDERRTVGTTILRRLDRDWSCRASLLPLTKISATSSAELLRLFSQLRLRMTFLAALREMFVTDAKGRADQWHLSALPRGERMAQICRQVESDPVEAEVALRDVLKDLESDLGVARPVRAWVSMALSGTRSRPGR